ncbi:hypothetical protein G9U52_17160 [Paenibacillus sp. S3N08]|uniref:Sporulation membrane protein YtrI C-terminal domain-containing protein n=2 Tax=Paenibacillus agricola TaxID=2716264 RepID=A0ABX0J8Q3_9BACL|nr:hypothetical protein [Paenibacillus agricola]
MLQATGLLIAGMIIGSALFLGIYHHHLNSTLIYNRELQDANEQLLQDNSSYRSNKNVQSRINRLDVVIESGVAEPLDKLVEQELERRIRNDLNVIKGQRISSFSESPHLFQALIAQKTYHNVLDKDYSVHVTTMVLVQTELKVWVTAKEWKRSPT